jgi:threonine dehydratase
LRIAFRTFNNVSRDCVYRNDATIQERGMSTAVVSNRIPSVRTFESRRLCLQRIAEARGSIDPEFLDSPQYEAETIGALFGCRLVVKIESLNPIRSFKGRGAQYLTSKLPRGARLVCSTTGNFGQGMAYAARKSGHALTVFTGTQANPLKVDRMRALGAEVRQVGEDADEAQVAAETHALDTGALLICDGRDAAIAEGAGTIAVELLQWPHSFDAILVPVGDGALIAGVGRWIKAHAPDTRVIGVCSAAAPAMARSRDARRILRVPARDTIADGLSISTPHAETLADFDGIVDDILLVDDPALVGGMRLAHRELGLVLEPSGAAGLAALSQYRLRFHGRRVATILTGGNVTPDQFRSWLLPDRKGL